MRITREQAEHYEREGYLFLPNCFSPAEVEVLRGELPGIFNNRDRRTVTEKDGRAIRSVYGSHRTSEVFRRLSQHPRIVEPARRLLGSDVYIYQFKVNAKAAFGGDVWEWHQDYIFWNREDGMERPRVTNALIFLDEVTEFNGPLYLIPGSHRYGMIDVRAQSLNGDSRAYADRPQWISNLTAKLKYSLDRETVAQLTAQHGIVAPKGPAGSVLFFDGNMVHGSPNNISPFDRVVTIVTFNSVENRPKARRKRRPDFLASRTFDAVVPVADDALLR